MPRQPGVDPALGLTEIAGYHQDVTESLRLYFSPFNPRFTARFAGQQQNEVDELLKLRLAESDVRSTLAVLTSLEASLRIDFESRCRKRLKDDLSRHFQTVAKKRSDKVRLDEDILEGWKIHGSVPNSLIGEIRGALRFRHWLAHGRYWTLKLGRKYDYDYLFLIASGMAQKFRFVP
jgi:hypothetical protein